MRKVLLISTLLFVFFFTTSIASAHRVFFGFGVLPPVMVPLPSAIVVPPPAYYSYPYDYYRPGYYSYRVWVPGYWNTIWNDYGWEKVWIPGHWEYRP